MFEQQCEKKCISPISIEVPEVVDVADSEVVEFVSDEAGGIVASGSSGWESFTVGESSSDSCSSEESGLFWAVKNNGMSMSTRNTALLSIFESCLSF